MEKSIYLLKISLVSILIASFSIVLSQNDSLHFKKKQHPIISFNYAKGEILQTTDFVKGDNLMGKPLVNYQLFSLKAMWQNPGYTSWQRLFHAPYYGVGFSIGDFHNPDEVGTPNSGYGILGIPIFRIKKFEMYSEFQFGLAWNWKHYDAITNPKNMVVGGGMTVHLNIGLNAFCPITKNLDLGLGMNFLHFSNGGFERPNQGFNILAPSAELKYHFNGRPNLKLLKPAGRLNRSNDLFFMLGYGDYQLSDHELDTNYFAIGGISVIGFSQLSNAFRLGIGADMNYWFGLNANPDGTPGPKNAENITIGFIVQPEVIIDKLTLVGGIGIYALHRNYGNFNQTYQRLGVRYDFYKNYSVGVNIRAINFMLAEFLEFNLGYKIKWEKH